MTEEVKKQNTQSRRAFLKGAGVVSVAAAAAMVGADSVEASEAAPEKAAGYRETDTVRAYYEAARF